MQLARRPSAGGTASWSYGSRCPESSEGVGREIERHLSSGDVSSTEQELRDCNRQRERSPSVGSIMEEERVPALSPGARMQFVNPDDVRMAEGRDRGASRGRRKVSPAPLSGTHFRRVPFH